MNSLSTCEGFNVVNLLNRYADAYDRKDLETVRHCYTADASFEIQVPGAPPRILEGIGAILGNAERTFSSIDWSRRHVLTNHVVAWTDETSCSVSSYLQLVDNVEGNVSISMTGTYYDSVVKMGGQWLIFNRLLKADSPFQLGRSPEPGED